MKASTNLPDQKISFSHTLDFSLSPINSQNFFQTTT